MFIPEIKDWPAPHRKLLFALLIAIVAILLLAWLFLAPRLRQYQKTRELCKECEAELAKWIWPSNAQQLQTQYNISQEKLLGDETIPGLRQIATSAVQRAVSSFQEQIKTAYPAETPEESLQLFVNTASRIDYRLFANQIDQELQKQNLHLPAALLTVEENSKTPIYQKVLHIWTLQKLLHIALESNLAIAPSATEGECEVALLPVLSYRINQSDTDPYLQEFPVKFTVTGTLDTFLAFLKALQDNEAFLPVKQLAIESRPPQEATAGQDVVIQQHAFTVVCTSFFLPQQPEIPSETAPTTITSTPQ